MSVAINDDGDLPASELNRYLGAEAPFTRQLYFNGTFGAPNFSLNQIFFSNVGTADPPATFSMSSLKGKRFGIYQNPQRSLLHTGTYTTQGDFALPIFIGYFGFGASGVLNPVNRGFPLAVSISASSDVIVSMKTGDGFTWSDVTLVGGQAELITVQGDAIRIFGEGGRRLGPSRDTTVKLSVAPCLAQKLGLSPVEALRGAHTIDITFKAHEESDDDPFDDPFDDPIDGPLDPPLGPIR